MIWQKLGAIKSSTLFHNLPLSLQKQTLFDKHWTAINQVSLLRLKVVVCQLDRFSLPTIYFAITETSEFPFSS